MAETTAVPDAPASWYRQPWVTMVAMYVFLPFGIYHMWRYRGWPLWLKWFSTVFGPIFAVVSFYISSTYIGIGPDIF